MKHLLRSRITGRFIPRSAIQIVPGRLYGYRGAVVRAGRLCSNGTRHISYHKKLHGFVRDSELQLIPKTEVDKYLQTA